MPEPVAQRAFTYRAFISYSHRDKAWADWLHRSLETWRVPSRLVRKLTAHGTIPRRLNPVFRDREELASAAELGRKVNEALAQSENLVVICSPASATSRWVNEEVLAYKRMGRAGRIFCLIVDGEPNATALAGREVEECFCPALRFQLDTNGQLATERAEPIAADARPGKDGKPNARLKLIAGMLDVGFDALKQREQQRRIRRMTAITALAMCVMAVTIVLGIFALVSRHRAVIAQHEAVVAKQAAERRQKQAEDLVDFMLGDLTTKLRALDRLDVLRAVDDKAMAYFKSLPPSDVNDTELAQRAKALQRIGEVHLEHSLPKAMDAFRQALLLNRKLVDQSPGDPLRQNAFAENQLWIGFAYWNEGKSGPAEKAFRESAAALERATALAPSNNDVQHNLDGAYNNLGHVAQARKELDAASRYYARDLALCQRMVAAHPDDVLWRNALGDAHDNLATVALMRGHLDQAIDGYLEEQHILRDVVAKQPQDRQMRQQLLIGDAILARTLALAGQTRAARKFIDAALGIGKAQMAFDPSHKAWKETYFYSRLLAAQLVWAQGDPAQADQWFKVSLATLQQLVHADPSQANWRRDLAVAQLASARFAKAHGQADIARTHASEADDTARKLLAGGAPKASLVRIAAAAELLLGQLAARRGDTATADKLRRQALTRMQAAAPHPDDPRDIALLAEALLANDDKAQAMPLLARLSAIGYQPRPFVAQMRADDIDYVPDPAVARRIARSLDATANIRKVAQTHGG
ncbi:MAG TPA: TIR domain-containing protein [Rhodanobacteraceae bacterium]|nr:TIR domain-containing protein [Rhodanobacteraceae bacterium]